MAYKLNKGNSKRRAICKIAESHGLKKAGTVVFDGNLNDAEARHLVADLLHFAEQLKVAGRELKFVVWFNGQRLCEL